MKKVLLIIAIILLTFSTSMSADRIVKYYFKTEVNKTSIWELENDLPYIVYGQKEVNRNTKPHTVWVNFSNNTMILSFDDLKDGTCDRAFNIQFTEKDLELMIGNNFKDANALNYHAMTCEDIQILLKEAL